MVRWDQPRQAVQAVSLLATFILGGSAAEASLRAESLAAGRTLTAVRATERYAALHVLVDYSWTTD